MKIAVTGSTGKLGTMAISLLKEKMNPDNIIALARNPEKANGLGVEVRMADYDKPDTLDNALRGIDTLMMISASEMGKRSQQHKNVIEAAVRNGIKWVIYTSLLHVDRSTLNLASEHSDTEQAIKASGIPHTILRNGWYSENYTGSIAGAIKAGAFHGSAGNGKLSLAARKDYAEAAVAVLTGEGHVGRIYELAGDEAYTLEDLAAEISRQSGRQIPYRDIPEAEYAALLKSFGLPEPIAQAIANWDVSASKDDLFDDSHQLSKLIGRHTTPLAESVKEAFR